MVKLVSQLAIDRLDDLAEARRQVRQLLGKAGVLVAATQGQQAHARARLQMLSQSRTHIAFVAQIAALGRVREYILNIDRSIGVVGDIVSTMIRIWLSALGLLAWLAVPS